MTGVSVLTAMDEAIEAIEKQWAIYEGAGRMSRARAAVAELIAADSDYDTSLAAFNNTTATHHYWPRFHREIESARQRRATALAACKAQPPAA